MNLFPQRYFSRKAGVTILACLIFAAVSSWAQEITLELSNSVTMVGRPVQLRVRVKGASQVDLPRDLSMNGLRAVLAGQSTEVSVVNMKMSSSVVYTYMVQPLIEGTFIIPPFEVKSGGKIFRTEPIELRAEGGGGGQPPQPPPALGQSQPTGQVQDSDQSGDATFADLIIPKKTVYVGEVVPVELRFFFPAGGRISYSERASFAGEGFTVYPSSKPMERRQEVNGRDYVVISFQTAITAVKTGKIEIPAAALEARVQVPTSSQGGMDDFFSGVFGGGMFSETRDMIVESKPAQIESIPLPKEGKPESFSGGIGKFSMTASVAPKQAAPGDPVTLTAVLAGQGNFEALTEPHLRDSEGWRSYPPSQNFEASDVIGYNGKKTYEFTLIAKEKKEKSPSVEFSYFDPSSQKYQTLTVAPMTVSASPSENNTPPPAATAASTINPVSAATPEIKEETSTAAGLAAQRAPGNFRSLFQRRDNLIANGVLLVVWLILLLYFILRKMSSSASAVRASEKRATRKELTRLAAENQNAADFYTAAAHYMASRLQLGELKGKSTLEEEIESLNLTEPVRLELLRILERDAELKYSVSGTIPQLAAEERTHALEALTQLDKSV